MMMIEEKRSVGRPKLSTSMSIGREQQAHTPDGRPPRQKLTGNLKLSFPLYKRNENEFYYYVFADNPGEIENAKAAYYEQCHYEDGRPCVVHNKGESLHLMRLPIEYKIQDDLDRERERRATLGAENKINTQDGDYFVDGRSSVLSVDKDDLLDPTAM